jgi:hypothetical protein
MLTSLGLLMATRWGVGEMTILVKDRAGLGICQSSYDVAATRL